MFGSLHAFLPLALFTTYTDSAAQSGDVLSVMPFLALARELAALLVPMQPRQAFRDDLEATLVAEARQQNAQLALTGYPIVEIERVGGERRWVIGAAAAAAVGSAVSIAGIVAYVLMHRERAA
jgi:hypothetical protein